MFCSSVPRLSGDRNLYWGLGWGGPDGLFAQQEREPIRGRPAVRGKRTHGGQPGQRVEEQGTWASRTQKHSEAGYGRPVDRGTWTAKTVKQPRQQPAHPQCANYWAPLTRKQHTPPHSAQPRHTNYWAPRTRERHQQEHRPQRPTERSDPTQHAKGRAGDCPGPRRETATRRNVTQGGVGSEAKKKVCVPKIDLQFRVPLINVCFFPKKKLLMWGGGVGQVCFTAIRSHRACPHGLHCSHFSVPDHSLSPLVRVFNGRGQGQGPFLPSPTVPGQRSPVGLWEC